jgi:hypothetical protein
LGRLLELGVSLKLIKPKVWRQFLIAESATIEDLHQAIQDACGWDPEAFDLEKVKRAFDR